MHSCSHFHYSVSETLHAVYGLIMAAKCDILTIITLQNINQDILCFFLFSPKTFIFVFVFFTFTSQKHGTFNRDM